MCLECAKEFTRNGSLRRHVRIHSGDALMFVQYVVRRLISVFVLHFAEIITLLVVQTNIYYHGIRPYLT
jgi:hypothetical protein